MEIGRGPESVEVRGRYARLIRPLNDTTRVAAVDLAPVVQVESERCLARRGKRDVAFALPASCRLHSAVVRIHFIRHVETELVITKPTTQQESPPVETQTFLCLASIVGDVRVSPGGHTCGCPAITRIEPHVDLVIVEVRTTHQQACK